jgi:hypothetical protein
MFLYVLFGPVQKEEKQASARKTNQMGMGSYDFRSLSLSLSPARLPARRLSFSLAKGCHGYSTRVQTNEGFFLPPTTTYVV